MVQLTIKAYLVCIFACHGAQHTECGCHGITPSSMASFMMFSDVNSGLGAKDAPAECSHAPGLQAEQGYSLAGL